MRTYRLLIMLLAIAVGANCFNADAKKRKSRKRVAKRTIIHPEPKNYDYVVGTTDSATVSDEVLEVAKYQPEYPGGTEGLMKFLATNIQYPEEAKKLGKDGYVVLQFIVEKDGSISNVNVLKSVHPSLDKEAVRVVSQIKRFVPGYNEDHAPVRVLYTLPVHFKLD